jgi:hypothetical protein
MTGMDADQSTPDPLSGLPTFPVISSADLRTGPLTIEGSLLPHALLLALLINLMAWAGFVGGSGSALGRFLMAPGFITAWFSTASEWTQVVFLVGGNLLFWAVLFVFLLMPFYITRYRSPEN